MAEIMKGPVLVCQEGEVIELSEDERRILSLGPKFNIMKKLKIEDFEPALEEAIMKYKWDCMGDKLEMNKELSEVAIEAALRELCTEEEYEELLRDEEEYKLRKNMVYDMIEKRFSYTKKRVTNTKGNSRIIFPKEAGKYEDEAVLEMVRMKLLGVYNKNCEENCKKGGVQCFNIDEAEMRGLKSLQKRVSQNELLVVPTDKSGRFAVMSVATYELAGSVHTKNDEEISDSIVK